MFNDLETTADKLNNNKVSELKKQIENSGVTKAVMSGSGSTIVGYIEEENKINNTLKELDSCYKNVATLKGEKQTFKVETKEKNYKLVYILSLVVLITFLVIIKKNIRKKIS